MAKKTNNQVSPAELRKIMLNSAESVVIYQCARATGDYSDVPETIKRANIADVDRIYEAVLPMIQQAGDLRAIEANSAADIITAVSKGKITIQDAERLMSMLRTQSAIESQTDGSDTNALANSAPVFNIDLRP